MKARRCRVGVHAWGAWSTPYYYRAGKWFQSRACNGCGKVETRVVLNYQPPENEVIALANLANRLGLTKLGTPIDAPGVVREPLDLGEIDPKLAGVTVGVWVGGPDPWTFLRFVQEVMGTVGPDLKDLDLVELIDRVIPWLCRAWGLPELELLRIGHELGPRGYLIALTRTCCIMGRALQRAAMGDDAPDLDVFRRAMEAWPDHTTGGVA